MMVYVCLKSDGFFGLASRPRVNGTEWNESREQEVGCEQRACTEARRKCGANYERSDGSAGM